MKVSLSLLSRKYLKTKVKSRLVDEQDKSGNRNLVPCPVKITHKKIRDLAAAISQIREREGVAIMIVVLTIKYDEIPKESLILKGS